MVANIHHGSILQNMESLKYILDYYGIKYHVISDKAIFNEKITKGIQFNTMMFKFTSRFIPSLLSLVKHLLIPDYYIESNYGFFML